MSEPITSEPVVSAETVTLPRGEYDAMRERLEELEDIIAVQRHRTGVTLPAVLADRIIDGEHPVTVWRDHRGLSQRALAAKAGISPSYLSEIESGAKPGSLETYKALAEALDTTLDWLVD